MRLRRSRTVACLCFPPRRSLPFATRSSSFQCNTSCPLSSRAWPAAAAGALLAYTTARIDLTRRAAGYIDRLLRGAKVADLPVQFPTKFELVINLKTAKAIGLTIPEALLLRADEL